MIGYLKGLDRWGLVAGLTVMTVLGMCIVLGSGNLRHYDPILLTYTFGVLFSAFAVAYRYAVWLQRPPTRQYLRRGFSLLFRKGRTGSSGLLLARSVASKFVAQKFIQRRGWMRWAIHFLIAWGCMLAAVITFPLVFGWLHFKSDPANPEIYRVIFLDLNVGEFHTGSWARYVVFNLLNLSAVMVTVGASLALNRRLKDGAALGRQQFGNDIVPLLLLLAISVTGLLLTFSMHLLGGVGYPVLSLVHAVVVSATLLYLPFGKLFHVFQRPAQLGVALYRRENEEGARAECRSCGRPFAGALHVSDLKQVMAETGFRWEGGERRPHWMDVCPACRRKTLAASHRRAGEGRERIEELHGETAVSRS